MISEQTLVFSKDNNTDEAKKKRINAILAKLGIGLVSAGAGAGAAMFFTSAAAPNAPTTAAKNEGAATTATTTPAAEQHFDKPEVSTEPKEATTVNDSMDFGHAFQAARGEVGANGFFVWHGKVFGTHYAEEQNKLSTTEQKEMYDHIMKQFVANHHITPGDTTHPNTYDGADERLVIIHDEAPHATPATNDMTFRDAFAVARAQVGPGGIFDWHGKHYNTYTREELSAMSPSEKHDFLVSVGKFEIHNMNVNDTNATVSEQDIDIVRIDQGADMANVDNNGAVNGNNEAEAPVTEHETSIITDKVVHLEDGSTARVVLADVDGTPVLRIDAENDGVFDMDITANDDNTYHLQVGDSGMDVTQEEFDTLFGADEGIAAGGDTEGVYEAPVDMASNQNYDQDILGTI